MSEINQSLNNSDEVEIDLVEVFYLLWGNIVKIILCLLIGAVVAFAYSRLLITPMYKATAKMYIQSTGSKSVVNLSDLQISSNLRADYKELLTSRELLEMVIDDLSLEYTSEDLNKMISVTNPTDTRILNVSVTSPVPAEAAAIANSLTRNSRSYLAEIMNTEEPSVYESALVPERKSSPSYSRNTMIGGLLGAMAYIAYILVRHFMNDTIVTADDVYKYLGVQPLAVIPEGNLGSFNKSTRRRKSSKKTEKKGEQTE